MKLIREFTTDIITESVLDEATNLKKWYVSGVTLQSNIKNRNQRIYPKQVLSEAIDFHVKTFMESNRALGELNHPKSGSNINSIDLERVSHKFVDVTEDNNNYITKAEVLNTPLGKIVTNLLESNVQLGISSRGLGNLVETKEGRTVNKLYLVSLGDIVSDPSGPDCFIKGVLESVEYEMIKESNGDIKFVQKEIDLYNKMLKESSREEINAAVLKVFDSFIKTFTK